MGAFAFGLSQCLSLEKPSAESTLFSSAQAWREGQESVQRESTTMHTFDVISTQCYLSGLVKHKFPILITVQGEDNFLTTCQTFRNKDRENGAFDVQKENEEQKIDFCFVLF